MQLSTLQETITVTGDSPMIEVDKASNVLNIDGEFQRLMPIQARRNYSDFLELTPGRHLARLRRRQRPPGLLRPRHRALRARAAARGHHRQQLPRRAAHLRVDGRRHGRRHPGEDRRRRRRSPMGTGLVMNIITKSGGNVFRGSGAFAYQPYDWNGNNVDNCSTAPGCRPGTGGTPTTAYVRQFDGALGGPLMRDKVVVLRALRRALSSSGISRTEAEVARIEAYPGSAGLFDNDSESWQPFAKVTSRFGRHDMQALLPARSAAAHRRPRVQLRADHDPVDRRFALQRQDHLGVGVERHDDLLQRRRTTTRAATTPRPSTTLGLTGPQIIIHNNATPSGATLQGTGRILEGGNLQSYNLQPASQIVVRGDLTYYKDGWAGSHEFQTGFFIAPRNTYNQDTALRERRVRARGAPPARRQQHRRRHGAVPPPLPDARSTCGRAQAEDRDIAIYVQDSWRPHPRLSLNLGVRADFVKRNDILFDITRQNSTEIGPRFGFSYQVTSDARTILRGSAVRVHEQVMGRDAITLFGANEAAADVNIYDRNGNGVFEASETVTTPARAASIADYEFADDLHQPYVNEFILGLRRQFPWQLSVDVAGIYRSYKDNWARVDINGIYPSGPNQPFGGFGAVDPNRGIIFQQQNNSWSTLEYRALEVTVAKNMSHELPADGRRQPAVAALRRHLEPDRPGEVHPAGDLRRATRCSTCRAATTRRTACRSPPARPCTPTGRPGRSTRCASAAPTWRRGASPWPAATPCWPAHGRVRSSISCRRVIRSWRSSGRPTSCSPTAPRRATRCRRGCASCSRPAARARCRRRRSRRWG